VLGKLYSELSQGANTKNKAEALKYLGFDPKTINKEMAENAEGTILKVLEKIKNSDVADKSALISGIFGSDKSVINGLSVLSENLDGVKEKLDKAKQAVSENEKVNGEYQDRINTLTNQLKILKNNFVNSLADIGKSVAPELKETVDWLTGIMKSIANFIKENPKFDYGIPTPGFGDDEKSDFADPSKGKFVNNRIIVYLKSNANKQRIQELVEYVDGTIIGKYNILNEIVIKIPKKTEEEINALCEELETKYPDIVDHVSLETFGLIGPAIIN